jgi:hypothetical protein
MMAHSVHQRRILLMGSGAKRWNDTISVPSVAFYQNNLWRKFGWRCNGWYDVHLCGAKWLLVRNQGGKYNNPGLRTQIRIRCIWQKGKSIKTRKL